MTRFVEALHRALVHFGHLPAWRAAGLLFVLTLACVAVLAYLFLHIAPYIWRPVDPRDNEITRLKTELRASADQLNEAKKRITQLEAQRTADEKGWRSKQNTTESALSKKLQTVTTELANARAERDQARAEAEGLKKELDTQAAAIKTARADIEALRGQLAASQATQGRTRAAHEADKKRWDAERKELERTILETEEKRATEAARHASAQLQLEKATKRLTELETARPPPACAQPPSKTCTEDGPNPVDPKEKRCRFVCLHNSEPDSWWKATIKRDPDARATVRSTESFKGHCGKVCTQAENELWARYRSPTTGRTYFWRMLAASPTTQESSPQSSTSHPDDRVEECTPGSTFPMVIDNVRKMISCPPQRK